MNAPFDEYRSFAAGGLFINTMKHLEENKHYA
jgi:hypothetical protein